MKLHILFPIVNKPTGGGNQFLRALRECFLSCRVYADKPEDADVLLFNSYPFVSAVPLYRLVSRLKAEKGNALTVIHRVDGPISVVRGSARDVAADRSIALFNQKMADATIYQSAWSREVCISFGVGLNHPSTTIPNAPDPSLFFSDSSVELQRGAPIRIVATSWSSNWRKGFDIYRYLDQHLDFSRYEMSFIGNSPIEFTNIRKLPPLPSKELGEALRQHDLYLTASIDDPCSNAVIEALHCGLPVVARRSGGHPELVEDGGVLYDGYSGVLAAIEQCSANLVQCRAVIAPPGMDEIGRHYLEFAQKVWEDKKVRKQVLPETGWLDTVRLLTTVAQQRYVSAITRRACASLPLREDRSYRNIKAFRKATWEPDATLPWNEAGARQWLQGLLGRLPLFLDSMRHRKDSHLYRYSYSGDLQTQPSLVASVFVAKIRAMAGLLDNDERQTLSGHIRSYQNRDGAITDPWVAQHSRWRRLLMVARSRSMNNLHNVETVRAETRQSFAALRCLGAQPERPFDDIPSSGREIEAYIQRLDWTRPWGAGSHVSHLVFFLHHHTLWFGVEGEWTATEVLRWVDEQYRRDDGAWYAKNAMVSPMNKVNGAMKMVTALDAGGVDGLANPEGLIDLCLGVVNEGHACNHFNVICVLHRCQKLTDYRQAEIRAYCLDRLRLYREHYWPWQGGFSFYPTGANDLYYNARVSTGMAEPDIHGTVLMLWGIVLIVEVLGWEEEFKLKRPCT
ncbi:MAG: glycosyltransferase family 4 protein [Candidatus Scalindua sp.]